MSSAAATLCRPVSSAMAGWWPGEGKCPGPRAQQHHTMHRGRQHSRIWGLRSISASKQGWLWPICCRKEAWGCHTAAAPTWQLTVALPLPEVQVFRMSTKDYQLLLGAHTNQASLHPAQRKRLKILRKQSWDMIKTQNWGKGWVVVKLSFVITGVLRKGNI